VPGIELADVTAAEVTTAVLGRSAAVSVTATQNFACGLRAFLRLCVIEGLVSADLSQAALPVTGRRRLTLPAGITTAGAQALPGSCDRRSALGRRDYALIITLLRLGLRRSEVARLRLDDIDWRAAEVVVRGKGAREDRLPLPVDVGKAIASYLRRGRRAGRDGSRAGASSAAAPKDGRAWRARRTRWTPGPACLPARGGTGRLLGDRAATRSHPNTDGRAYDRE
jgi:integrase/recombinase XerD